jgi:hypothetical protein
MFWTGTGRRSPRAATVTLIPCILCIWLVATAGAATRDYTVGDSCSNPYGEQVYGAGSAEGDVWGGEQGTTPDPGDQQPKPDPGPVVDAAPAGWMLRLVSLFTWIQSSFWFADQE